MVSWGHEVLGAPLLHYVQSQYDNTIRSVVLEVSAAAVNSEGRGITKVLIWLVLFTPNT